MPIKIKTFTSTNPPDLETQMNTWLEEMQHHNIRKISFTADDGYLTAYIVWNEIPKDLQAKKKS